VLLTLLLEVVCDVIAAQAVVDEITAISCVQTRLLILALVYGRLIAAFYVESELAPRATCFLFLPLFLRSFSLHDAMIATLAILRARTLFLSPATMAIPVNLKTSYLESLAVHPARALLDEREEEMPTQFIGRVDLQIRIQELAEALVIDVLKQRRKGKCRLLNSSGSSMRFLRYRRASALDRRISVSRIIEIRSKWSARSGAKRVSVEPLNISAITERGPLAAIIVGLEVNRNLDVTLSRRFRESTR